MHLFTLTKGVKCSCLLFLSSVRCHLSRTSESLLLAVSLHATIWLLVILCQAFSLHDAPCLPSNRLAAIPAQPAHSPVLALGYNVARKIKCRGVLSTSYDKIPESLGEEGHITYFPSRPWHRQGGVQGGGQTSTCQSATHVTVKPAGQTIL